MLVTHCHFLRPQWLFSIPFLIVLSVWLWYQKPALKVWHVIGDKHLLAPLIKSKKATKKSLALLCLLASNLFIIIGLAGPSWSKLPIPSYQKMQARVVILDLSDTMLINDIMPNRLIRAKFKLHDLLKHTDLGQIGLVVFTSEPFVVSPLTDDGKTIDALLEALTPTIMPVDGYQLDKAIIEAAKLIGQAGFTNGQILILTATPPNKAAIDKADYYHKKGIDTSIMPVIANQHINSLYQPLATAGGGMVLSLNSNNSLRHWLELARNSELTPSQNNIPLWQDEGRWFLLPALFFLLPVFRRGWLQRTTS
jgi:Ca-activated chloride channel family protein